MIVLDASALVELLRGSPAGEIAARRIADADGSAHIPHLATVEVVQVLRRLAANGSLTPERAARALEHLAALPVARHDHDPLLPRIWQLRDNLTASDAVYVALAEALGATLITLDTKLASAPGVRAEVDVLGN